MAAIIRQGIDHMLDEHERAERMERVMALAGCVSGPPDLAHQHDAYLEEAYASVREETDRPH
jgi:hypothetical protein